MAASERFFKRGDVIFTEGQASHCIYLIQTGTVSIRKRRGPTNVEIAKVFSNEVIGELSFFDRKPRSATCVAITDLKALEINFVDLEKIYNSVPDYIKTIMACVATRLRRANEALRKHGDEVSEEAPGKSMEDLDATTALKTIEASRTLAPSNKSETDSSEEGDGEPEKS